MGKTNHFYEVDVCKVYQDKLLEICGTKSGKRRFRILLEIEDKPYPRVVVHWKSHYFPKRDTIEVAQAAITYLMAIVKEDEGLIEKRRAALQKEEEMKKKLLSSGKEQEIAALMLADEESKDDDIYNRGITLSAEAGGIKVHCCWYHYRFNDGIPEVYISANLGIFNEGYREGKIAWTRD